MPTFKTLYDLHCHVPNLSHSGFLSFITGFVFRKYIRFTDLAQGNFLRIIRRFLVGNGRGLVYLKNLSFMFLILLFLPVLMILYLVIPEKSWKKGVLNKPVADLARGINTISVGDMDTANKFLLLERDILRLDEDLLNRHKYLDPKHYPKEDRDENKKICEAVEKDKPPTVEGFKISKKDKDEIIEEFYYNKVILTPLIMDFGYKSEQIKGIVYNQAPLKEMEEQVADMFNGIKQYMKKSPFRVFEIYPFMGITPENYDLGIVTEKLSHTPPLPPSMESCACYLEDPEYPGGAKKLIIFSPPPDKEAALGFRDLSIGHEQDWEEINYALNESWKSEFKNSNNIPRMLYKYFNYPVGINRRRELECNYNYHFSGAACYFDREGEAAYGIPREIEKNVFEKVLLRILEPGESVKLKKAYRLYGINYLINNHLEVNLVDDLNSLFTRLDDDGIKLFRYNGDIGSLGLYFFAGIKFYPPLGFEAWPTNLPAGEKNYTERDKVKFIYQFCQQRQIPITVHCTDVGFDVVECYMEQNQPGNWNNVLRYYKKLRVNFAHFGIHLNKKPLRDCAWAEEITGLMRKYPNVYADISCGPYKEELAAIMKQLLSGRNNKDKILDKRLFFGSDTFLSLFLVDSYYKYFYLFIQGYDVKYLDDFMTNNPEKFLFPHEETQLQSEPDFYSDQAHPALTNNK